MKHKIWALITGTIRSEIYLRIVILKLCAMRNEGLIEGIVYSTWDNEIDKVDGLRSELLALGIVFSETPYIDDELENRVGDAPYERQRVNIIEGLKKIPHNSFVLKLRSDYIIGINEFFKQVRANCLDKKVETFGDFSKMFSYKISMYWNGFYQFFYGEDRFFYGFKSDLEKNFTHTRRLNVTKFHMFAEMQLLNGYNWQFRNIIRNLWSILPISFGEFFAYCSNKTDDELNIPRIIHRAFATMSVYTYTHINLMNDDGVNNNGELLHIVDLYSNRLRSNAEIARVVNGEFVNSRAADVFKDELRKIATGLPEVAGYTHEEYLELRKFVEEDLRKTVPLEKCPFVEEVPKVAEGADAAGILLSKYGDEVSEIVDSIISDEFDSVGKSLYPKINNISSRKLRIPLIQAAIFDRDIDAIIEYIDVLKEDSSAFDEFAWRHTTRNIFMHCNSDFLNAKAIYALYKVFECYWNMVIDYPEIKDTYNLLMVSFNDTGHSRVLNFKLNYGSSINHIRLLNHLVRYLCESVQHKRWGWNEYCIMKSLLMIKPECNPFPDEIIPYMRVNNLFAEVDEITGLYGENVFVRSNWLISEDISVQINEGDTSRLLSYRGDGKKDIEAILRYLWSSYWREKSLQPQILSFIDTLSGRLHTSNFVLKATHFLTTNNLSISRKDMENKENFFILLEMLYRKERLVQNLKIVQEMCLDDVEREMFLQAFLRLEADKRLEFFSMKNGMELWLHYRPYMEHEKSKVFEVPVWVDGKTWPEADRYNTSAFAAYMRLIDNNIFISIEMSAKDTVKTRTLAKFVGFDEKNSPSVIIRLHTKRIPIKGEKGLTRAVNEAMDEFCQVGEKVLAALDSVEV